MYVDGFAHRWRAVSLLIFFLLVTCAMPAEEGVLVLVVTDTRQHPFANVQIGTEGDAGSPQFTDQNGKARLRLAPNTKPAAWVTLQLGSLPNGLDLDFISPFNRRVRVPPFDNGPDNYDEVTLARHADKEILESGSGMLAVHANVNQSVAAQKKKAAAHPRTTSRDRSNHIAPFGYRNPRLLSVALYQTNAPTQSPVAPPTREELQNAAWAATAQRFGFSVAQVKSAIASWGGDALVWKLILLKATTEDGGSDPFPAIRTTSNDMHFGAGNWSLSECSLQPLLLKFRKTNPKRFAEIVGADTQWLIRTASAACEVSSQAMLKRVVDGSGHLQPTWRKRFRKLGYEHSFQRLQVNQMTMQMHSAQDSAYTLGLQSEQALAFCYDVATTHGPISIIQQRQNLSIDLAAFQQEIGRPPDEQEKLQMLANRLVQSDKVRGRNPLVTATSISRATLLSQGQGVVLGTRYELEEFGIGMQDVQAGADLLLNDDPAVLQALREGWIPSEGQPPTPRASETGPYSPVADPAESCDLAGEKQLLGLINQERVKQGLQPLAVDPRLIRAATKHNKLLVAHKEASHQFAGEQPLPVRFANEGLTFDQEGENTAVDQDVPLAHQGLVADRDHRDIILNPNYNAVGVCVIRSGGQLYVTEDFAHLPK